jgi:hypothetical protein
VSVHRKPFFFFFLFGAFRRKEEKGAFSETKELFSLLPLILVLQGFFLSFRPPSPSSLSGGGLFLSFVFFLVFRSSTNLLKVVVITALTVFFFPPEYLDFFLLVHGNIFRLIL